MQRRTMLKRLGAGGVGIAALAGSASGNGVRFDGEIVVEDGRTYVYRADVDPSEVSTAGCCCAGVDGCKDWCQCCTTDCRMK